MRISCIRGLKQIILAFSSIMFFYQAQIAVNKFLNPPVVDSTDLLNIADIDPPLITICPKYQIFSKMTSSINQDDLPDLLLGKGIKNNITDWGVHLNMTFEEWVEEIVDLDKGYPTIKFKVGNGQFLEAKYERRFYPKYGRCIDFSNYTITGRLELYIFLTEMKLLQSDPPPEAEVYLTDKKLRTRSTVHSPSHWGPSIIIQPNQHLDYLVKVQQLSSYDPRQPDVCREYTKDEFERCVDEELQDLWKPIIGCNPPWLSHQDQCNASLNTTDMVDLLHNGVFKTIDNIIYMRNYAAKERCRKACLVTRINFFKNRESVKFCFGCITLKLVFDDIVVRKTKILAYNFSDLLIDIGSSLGLWFGLSVFGITDLGIIVIEWAEKMKRNAFKMFLE